MILYHPAVDFYHCWLRMSSVMVWSNFSSIEFDRMRIVDFIICFPSELKNCRLPASFSAVVRSEIKKLPPTYEAPESIRQAFIPMGKVQNQVVMDMIAKNIIKKEIYSHGLLMAVEDEASKHLLRDVASGWRFEGASWFSTVLEAMFFLPLNGKDGLKDRTHLMEYKYDE